MRIATPALFAWIVVLVSLARGQGENLEMVPPVPEVGKDFQVALLQDVARLHLGEKPVDAKYEWTVEVKEGDRVISLPDAGLPSSLPDKPVIKISQARPSSVYSFTLIRTKANVPETFQTLLVEFGRTGAETKIVRKQNASVPAAPSADPPVSPTASTSTAEPTPATSTPASDTTLTVSALAESGGEVSVSLKSDVDDMTKRQGAEYKWEVEVKDLKSQSKVDMGTGLPSPLPAEPTITIAKSRPNSKYVFKLTKTKMNAPSVTELTLFFLAAGLQPVTTLPMGTAEGTDEQNANKDKTPVPKPLDEKAKQKVSERLKAARLWADGIAEHTPSASLVLPVSFFETKLTTSRDGKIGLKTVAIVPLLDAEELYRAMYNTANKFSEGTDSTRIVAEWLAEREKFQTALVETVGEIDDANVLWKEFLEDWQKEVMTVAPERFREALLQAGLIVTAVLLGHEKAHIEAALKGGVSAKSANADGSTSSGGYGYSHAAVHHARAMHRIHFRHERRMARIGY